MNAARIITGVTNLVPGLKDAKWREFSGAGYFTATRDGKRLAVAVDTILLPGEMTVVFTIVAELLNHESGAVA